MADVRPAVCVLTNGSGSDGASRLGSTSALLESVGAAPGPVYGRMSDREIYRAILDGDHARFIALADELATSFIERNVRFVAGDAVEGFNPSHDVCRYVINAAVRIAAAAGHTLACHAFVLDGSPTICPRGAQEPAHHVALDDERLARKLQAAYQYGELRPEVERALARYGREPFRSECLWPVDLSDPYGWDPDDIPFYESYGAERVASGAYEQVVTFRGHVKPLADALWCHRAVTA